MTLRSLEESIPLKLLRAREAVMERFRPHLLAAGITEQQWRVIRALAEAGPMEISALARKTCLLPPSVSRIVRDLSDAGLLSRKVSSSDARIAIAALTIKGAHKFERMSKESIQIYAGIEEQIGAQLCERLLRDLDKLIATLEDGKTSAAAAE